MMMSIVRNLSDRYIFDIVLFTSEKRYYDEEFLSYGGTIIRIPNYEGNTRIRRRADYYLRGNRIFREVKKAIVCNGPYKAIHCNNPFESGLCLKAAAEAGVQIRIAHIHVIGGSCNIIRSCINSRYRMYIKKYGTLLIGCSEEACDSMYGQHVAYRVILNPYDENRFCQRKEVTCPNLIITQIGRFCPNKNQIFSVGVLKEIVKEYPDAKLNFVGFDEGGYKDKLIEEIEILGLQDNVAFYPGDANTPSLLENSAALIFPSISEGFGIVLIEAQAMGVKCYVSSSVPKTTNVGGCKYLSLDAGAKKWADIIIGDYRETRGIPSVYDCSKFATKHIMEVYNSIYQGRLLERKEI